MRPAQRHNSDARSADRRRADQFDVVVIGAGLMGAATAWSLARRARSVLLLEQFAPGHTQGSSHGSARIVRRAYADALYTQLTGRALELWRELEQQSGMQLLRMLGGLDFGDGRAVADISNHLAELRVGHEVLTADEAERRWPGMCFAGRVVYHPQAGTVDAALAVETFTAEAVRHGAQVWSNTKVLRVLPDDARTLVELEEGERLAAGTVVAASGAWTEPLLGGLVRLPPLTVTQQQVFHFPRLNPDGRPWPSAIHHGASAIYHLAGGRDGGPDDDRKLAEHRFGTPTTAAGRTGVVDPASRARVVDYVKRWLPGLISRPASETTCLYTSTPSEDFVLDRLGSLVVCSACSGHGAKFAPLIGELTAELVTAPSTADIPVRFRLASHRGDR